MGADNAKQYTIDLKIDKEQYLIKDQIKGYIIYDANPFLNSEYNKQMADYNLELKLEFVGNYDQTPFIFKQDLIKNCIFENERKINEKVAFTYDIDLMTTSGCDPGNFKIIYSIIATICHQNQIFHKKEINFLIYRPFIDVERPFQVEKQFIVKPICCCNFGQINIKVSLNKTDILVNDIANILIEWDQSLSTKNISNFQIDLQSKIDFSEELTIRGIYNTVRYEGLSEKKYKYILKFPVTCTNINARAMNHSLECPQIAKQFFIQITCNTGMFTDSMTIDIPVIVFKSYEQNLKDERQHIGIHQPFDKQLFNEILKDKFIHLDILQERFYQQIPFHNFYEFYNHQPQPQPEEENNLIIIQQQKR